MTDLTQELKRRQLIKELPPVQQPDGRVGRPTQPIALNETAPWSLLGIHTTGRGVTTELTTLSGDPLGGRHVDDTPLPTDPDRLVTHLATVLRRRVASLPQDRTIIGIGAGFPGYVADGVLCGAHEFPWHGLPIKDWWMDTLAEAGLSQVSVTIAGETQLEALHASRTAEGSSAGHTTLYVGGGPSISGALIVNNQIQPGDHGAAGQLAHLPVGGETWCACGRRGCLDTVAGLQAILASSQVNDPARVAGDQAAAIDWLRDQSSLGSSTVRSALDAAGEALDIGLQSACAVLDPASIIVGGHLGCLWPALPTTDLAGDFGVTVSYLEAGAAETVAGALLAAQDACLTEPLTWTSPDTADQTRADTGPRLQHHPKTYPRAEIIKIAVDRAGVRSAVVQSPSDPRQTLRHGLGAVGQPIAPYLGHRVGHDDTAGYEVVLPDNREALYVYQSNPEGHGHSRERRLPWAALGAPDLPNRFALRRETAS